MSFNFDLTDRLPAELAGDEHWTKARAELLASMRADADGLPLTTSMNLIMERMATFYTITRKREADPDYKVSANDMRQNNAQWLAMTTEFNRQITIGEDNRRHAMIERILSIIKNSLMMIEDDKVRDDVRKSLEAGFLEAGF